ncbi:MAG: outer membrane beta-barrel protein [Bacteroidetes bacterium]|nr:outer membrane beta-barrel protein [Bacteroidota bacterium]
MKHLLLPALFLLITGPLVGELRAQQSGADSLRQTYALLFERLKPDLQHTGLKLRFDAALQFPISRDIRIPEAKIMPGFGFNLGVGYGFTDYLSAYAGFISLSHSNEPVATINSEQAGFDGFHGAFRIKFNPYGRNQYYTELGVGIFELVDQQSDGFSGSGFSLTTGTERFLTREFTMGFSVQYRFSRFDQRIRQGTAEQINRSVHADMVMFSFTFIYTMPDEKTDRTL